MSSLRAGGGMWNTLLHPPNEPNAPEATAGAPLSCAHLHTPSGHSEPESAQTLRPCPHELLFTTAPFSPYASNWLSPLSYFCCFAIEIITLLPSAKVFLIPFKKKKVIYLAGPVLVAALQIFSCGM